MFVLDGLFGFFTVKFEFYCFKGTLAETGLKTNYKLVSS